MDVYIKDCKYGEIFNPSILRCTPCPIHQYSFADPFKAPSCLLCDQKRMTCEGGDVVYPKAGYWRMNVLSDNFIKCPQDDACLYCH